MPREPFLEIVEIWPTQLILHWYAIFILDQAKWLMSGI